MTKIRQKHNKQIKFKAALALLKSEKTVAQISLEFGVHQSVLHRWKKILLETGPELFDEAKDRKIVNQNDNSAELERKIGQLTMEVDFLKKVLGQ